MEDGETVILFPVPAGVTPQDVLNHCATAPEPADPPDNVRVVDSPAQMDDVPDIPVGADDKELTVTVTVAQVVVLQVPLLRTK